MPGSFLPLPPAQHLLWQLRNAQCISTLHVDILPHKRGQGAARTMSLILYDYKMAPNPRRARILLAEKLITHETIQIDLAAGEHLGEAYRAINPACTVPALRLPDGTIITENTGIAAYIEAAYPEPPMLGRTPVEKGLVASWNARVEFEGLMAVGEALRNSAPGMAGRALTGPESFVQVAEIAARGLMRTEKFFDMLDAHLQGRNFVAIEHFSMADITAVVTVDFARVVRRKPKPEHENIARWRAALAERASLAT
jgi:glutathione S-transferase